MAQDAYTFIEYCKYGNIDDIKKMSLKNCNLNWGFRWACYNGHYNIVLYLVELYKNDKNYDMINIHSYDEWGFRYACMMGRYNIVKYLAELYKNNKNYEKINIHAINEEGFRWACINGHYIIVKYLMKLLRKHKYKPFNNYLMIFDKFHKYKL